MVVVVVVVVVCVRTCRYGRISALFLGGGRHHDPISVDSDTPTSEPVALETPVQKVSRVDSMQVLLRPASLSDNKQAHEFVASVTCAKCRTTRYTPAFTIGDQLICEPCAFA
jgi:hypothetical protein